MLAMCEVIAEIFPVGNAINVSMLSELALYVSIDIEIISL